MSTNEVTFDREETGTYIASGEEYSYWKSGRFGDNFDEGRVYANFDLPFFTQLPISAYLVAPQIKVVTADPFETFELWDSTATSAELGNDSINIYNDLGSGKLYAKTNLNVGTADRIINLNDDFLKDLAANNGEEITIGGVLRGSFDSQPNDEYLSTFFSSFKLVVTFGDNLISIGDATVKEGKNGLTQAKFNVSLSQSSTSPITVNYSTANGTANAPSDYQTSNGIIEFAPGQTKQTISVLVKGDTTSELDENFFVNLSSVNGAAAIGDSQGIATIINDDNTPVTFSINDVTVNEGNKGNTSGQLIVTRSDGSNSAASVKYSLKKGSASSTDFSLKPGTVNFQPGQTNQVIPFTIKGDNIAEALETFSVKLSSQDGLVTDNTGVVTINDNDRTDITINDISLKEGSKGTTNAKVTVELSNPSEEVIAINYSLISGSAKASEDFLGNQGKIIINPGKTSANLTIPVKADNKKEDTESFSVKLTGVSTDVNASIKDNSGTITILDDDPIPKISFQKTGVSVKEGNAGLKKVKLAVILSNPSQDTVEIKYKTVSGQAKANQDFSSKSGTLKFKAGETQGNILVNVFGDFSPEKSEKFSVQLSSPKNANLGAKKADITIKNDDKAVKNAFLQGDNLIGTNSSRYDDLLNVASQTAKVNRNSLELDTSMGSNSSLVIPEFNSISPLATEVSEFNGAQFFAVG